MLCQTKSFTGMQSVCVFDQIRIELFNKQHLIDEKTNFPYQG